MGVIRVNKPLKRDIRRSKVGQDKAAVQMSIRIDATKTSYVPF